MKSSIFGFLAVGVLLTGIIAIATAGDAKDDAIKKDRKQIEGTWRVVAVISDGEELKLENARVVNGSDGTWSLMLGETKKWKGISTFDPTKKPKTIDFTTTEGPDKGMEGRGIYELGEKTRKLCFVDAGKERPTEFSSMPGSGRILVTFEREKAK